MPLTSREILALWERRKAGESTADLCKEIGMGVGQLFRYWRNRGLNARSLPSTLRDDSDKLRWNRRAYILHYIEEKTWEEVATIMGWEGSIKALTFRINRYAKLVGMSTQWKGATKSSQQQRVTKRGFTGEVEIGLPAKKRQRVDDLLALGWKWPMIAADLKMDEKRLKRAYRKK